MAASLKSRVVYDTEYRASGMGERILRFGHNIRQLSPSRKFGDSTYSVQPTFFFFFFWHDARKSKEMQGWTLKIVRTFVAESTRFFSHSLFIKLVHELFTINELFSFWKTKKNSRVHQSSKPSRVLNSRPEQYPFPRERSASCARCSCSPAPLFVQFFLL